MIDKKQYVVLEHLLLPDRGMRFWSINTGNNTKIYTGETAYKEILFTDDSEEASKVSQMPNTSQLPSFGELVNYWAKQYEKNILKQDK